MISAFIVWIVLATITGLVAMFYGPGVVVLIAGILLGICGATVHIATAVIGVKLHWLLAGPIIGFVTVLISMMFFRGDTLEIPLALILFGFFTLSSYMIFPIAEYMRKKTNINNINAKE